jgi:hypothetical protein
MRVMTRSIYNVNRVILLNDPPAWCANSSRARASRARASAAAAVRCAPATCTSRRADRDRWPCASLVSSAHRRSSAACA